MSERESKLKQNLVEELLKILPERFDQKSASILLNRITAGFENDEPTDGKISDRTRPITEYRYENSEITRKKDKIRRLKG
jgi:hypothetical protein